MTGNKCNIMIVGFGTVGQGFYELFNSKKNIMGIGGCKVSEVVDIRFGLIHNPDEKAIRGISEHKNIKFSNEDVINAIKESTADVMCEFTWVNYVDAEPAFSYIRTALESGKDVITTNKGPIAVRFKELTEIAKRNKKKILFKGTVMAGTPSFNILALLPGAKPIRVRGIMNGTTNYILTKMTEEMDYSVALKEAQVNGYAEADPTNDVDGFDAAAKAAIISNVLGWNHQMKDVKVKGIRNVSREEAASGVKLLVNVDEKGASVGPERLSSGDILREVKGVMNAIEIETDTLGKIYVLGPGAGKIVTAQAALTDLMEIVKER
ncbi:MAG: homoserine dehydrogenase [Thermoplasmata archaeon]